MRASISKLLNFLCCPIHIRDGNNEPPPPDKLALDILAHIYRDIHLAAFYKRMLSLDLKDRSDELTCLPPEAQPTDEEFSLLTESYNANVIDTMQRTRHGLNHLQSPSSSPPSSDQQQARYIAFVKEFKWMLLSICGFSKAFTRTARSADDQLWNSLVELIRQNAVSIELFAKSRELDWLPQIPADYRPQCGGVVTLPRRTNPDPYPRAISLNGDVIIPKYKGVKQIDIADSFFVHQEWRRSMPPFRRLKDDGPCALCRSLELCDCDFPLFKHPLIELREYPERGIGVRCLYPIEKYTFIGEYIGKLIKNPPDDTAYALDHGVGTTEETRREVCIIDSAVYGNWTRYINHSCTPNALFVSVPVGKKVLVLVQAIRDIEMFEEITVDYGDDYFSEPGRECLCLGLGCSIV